MPRFGRSRRVYIQVPRIHFWRLKKAIGITLLAGLFFIGVQFFYFVERNIQPALFNIARVRVEQLATEAINDSISKKIAQQTDIDKLIQIHYDENGVIQSVVFDYAEYARIQAETTARVQDTLHALSQTVVTIPLGQAFNSNILANMGPDIPLTLSPMGSAIVDLEYETQTAGINMVMVTVYAIIQANVAIVLPFETEPSKIQTRVPVSNTVIVGQVPQFYYQGGQGSQESGGLKSNASGGGMEPSPPDPPVTIMPPIEF